jgi:quinol monooxygenase YgiN
MGDFVKRDAAPDLFADIETVTRHEESAQNFDLFVDAEIADVYESEVLDLAKMMGYD